MGSAPVPASIVASVVVVEVAVGAVAVFAAVLVVAALVFLPSAAGFALFPPDPFAYY